MSNIEALALVAGELTAMPWNLVTSPGRAIADFVVTRAYGDDPVELMRNRQVIDKWRVDGRQVKNFFEDQLAPVYDAIEQVGGQNLSTGWAGVRRH